MRWIRALGAEAEEPAEVLGGKAHGLVVLRRLGLPVPAAFVVTTAACRAFLSEGRLPAGLREELAAAMADLEVSAERRFGGARAPLAVSVRSGASVSMPGMMNTILNLGLTAEATAGLAAETGDARFALDSRLRFVSSFASALTNTEFDAVAGGIGRGVAGGLGSASAPGLGPASVPALGPASAPRLGPASASRGGKPGDEESRLTEAIGAVEDLVRQRSGRSIPDDATRQLELAVETVFSSWDTSRARTYREVHDIPHDLGTAVIVQVMAFGNRDDRSGTGVAFSRDPNTGESVPFGDVLFGCQGDDVVSGRSMTRPLRELADREPAVWSGLVDALGRAEGHYRDACYVEFTFQAGELWLLQVRPGRFVGAAAVRVATDLVDEGIVTRRDALLRVSPQDLRNVRTPRIVTGEADILARGVGACPGVAVGRVATSTDAAVCMAADGPVILVRPETSPHDMRGLAAAAGIVTARGGPASHAAVVARALGKPAVVGVAGLVVDDDAAMQFGGRTLAEGTLVTIDGTGGDVALGRAPIVANPTGSHLNRLLEWADDVTGDRTGRADTVRLSAAYAVLRREGKTNAAYKEDMR